MLESREAGPAQAADALAAANIVADFGRFALAGAPMRAVLEEATRLAVEVLGADRSAALRFLPETGAFAVEAITCSAPGYGIGLRVASQVADEAFASNGVIVIDDYSADAGHWSGPVWEDSQSVIVVPVRGRSHRWGVFGVSSRTARSWHSEEVVFVRLLGNVLAEVIEAHAALERSEHAERLLRSIVEASTDVIAGYDLDLRITFVNQAVEEASGFPVEQVMGKTIRELGVSSEIADRWEHELRGVVESGTARRLTFTRHHPAGPRHYETQLSPQLDTGGAVVGIVSITRNLSPPTVQGPA